MNNPVLTFLNLVYPFLFGCIALIFQIFIRKAESDLTSVHQVRVSLAGFVEFETAIRRLWVIRAALIVVALAFFVLPAFRDYAGLFPAHLQMEVFFDDAGIESGLKQFSRKELGDLPIAEDWRAERDDYILSLNNFLEGIKNPFRFASTPSAVRSKGENYCEVKKLESWGWQKYRIVSGKGSVTHLYEVPQQTPRTIRSSFELLETDSNNIEMSLADIYFNWTKVMKPEYKQEFIISPDYTLYSHNLTALTKVRFFPYLDVGKTVYLMRSKEGNKYVPIGYAIYYPD